MVEEVIDQGICVACGACVGLCPYFHYYDGKVVATDDCRADTWRCLQLCPRADSDETRLDRLKGDETERPEIGAFRQVLIARANGENITAHAQYGGVVSALLLFALERGLIRSAVLTDRGGETAPMGIIAKNKDEILRCGGSRYTGSGGLAAFNKAIREGEEELAVVGLPCQMEALSRMQLMSPDGEERARRVGLRIGLFCTWALDYRGLSVYLEEQGIGQPVHKYDIPPPPAQIFQVRTNNGWKAFPLDEIRPFVQKGCLLCEDMTAEWADISVGAVEGMEGWNTVVIRSAMGSELIDAAREAGILETGNLPEANLQHLREASFNKRKRGAQANKERRQRGM